LHLDDDMTQTRRNHTSEFAQAQLPAAQSFALLLRSQAVFAAFPAA
jgi:hypothetical protein